MHVYLHLEAVQNHPTLYRKFVDERNGTFATTYLCKSVHLTECHTLLHTGMKSHLPSHSEGIYDCSYCPHTDFELHNIHLMNSKNQ